MIEAGAVPGGEPMTTGQISRLPKQPFGMNALTNHLSGKRYLFRCEGEEKVVGVDGRTAYTQKVWIALPDGFDEPDD